ncbi:HypC/HybG/HupF family hydrogenase formation chaperone [Nonomuraea cavernae]|nr:HypC/HybG/HupF family hydrogenase formation chaperone [Nonomuraea cavernae]MCA2188887.1 SIS domain-containing protein [Nonomuraea cavernae]
MGQQAGTAPLDEAAARRAGPGRALAADAGRIVTCALDMAERFHRKGRLLTFGDGAAAADAGHLAVEFTHPVIVGKRALPAISLANDAAAVSGIAAASGYDSVFATQLRLLGRPEDIAVGFLTGDRCGSVRAALAAARDLGMLTVALTASTPAASIPGANPLTAGTPTASILTAGPLTAGVPSGGAEETAPGGSDDDGVGGLEIDHVLPARTGDPRVAREIHVTIYHVLWELVHVFYEDPVFSLTPAACHDDGGCVTCADTAVPVRVTEVRDGGLAVVDTGSGTEEISVALVEARVGDVVLVHAKEAIAVLGGDGA